jgi:hypothetical protein
MVQNATTKDDRLEKALQKDSFFGGSGGKDDEGNASDDIVHKLQNVMTLAQTATSSVVFNQSPFQMQAALLVMLQMVDQSKKQTASLWNDFYESSGKPLFQEDTLQLLEWQEDVMTTTDAVVNPNKEEVLNTLIDQLHLSDWAYLEETVDIRCKLKEQTMNSAAGYQWHLIRHVKTNEPGRVGHFMALDRNAKVALISVKGTSALSDMITDACGVPVRYNMTEISESGEAGDTTTVSCHEGILDASLAMAEDVQPLVEELFLPAGYKVLLVGHSLGAGVACMLGLLLRARIPALRRPKKLRPLEDLFVKDTSSKDSLPLEVIAFAPPPMLNLEAAIATSNFVTSIVNNDDMIPRASLSNLVYLLRFLAIIDEKLEEKGLRPDGPKGAVLLLKKVLVDSRSSDEEDASADVIMTAKEIFDGLNEARGEGDNSEFGDYRIEAMEDLDHLYVPGRVVVVYEKLGSQKVRPSLIEEEIQPSLESCAKEELLLDTEESKSLVDEIKDTLMPGEEETKSLSEGLESFGTLVTEIMSEDESKEELEVIDAGAIVTDGAAPVLRHINVNGRMLSDHMPDAYEKTLRALM